MPTKKKTNIKESNLSKTPPWPGIRFPESFMSADLLRSETIISPTKDKINIIKIEQ